MKPDEPKKREWPRFAIGPLGNRARFEYLGAVPHGWKLEIPLPGTAAAVPLRESDLAPPKSWPKPAIYSPELYAQANAPLEAQATEPPKRKPGRPKKKAAE